MRNDYDMVRSNGIGLIAGKPSRWSRIVISDPNNRGMRFVLGLKTTANDRYQEPDRAIDGARHGHRLPAKRFGQLRTVSGTL